MFLLSTNTLTAKWTGWHQLSCFLSPHFTGSSENGPPHTHLSMPFLALWPSTRMCHKTFTALLFSHSKFQIPGFFVSFLVKFLYGRDYCFTHLCQILRNILADPVHSSLCSANSSWGNHLSIPLLWEITCSLHILITCLVFLQNEKTLGHPMNHSSSISKVECHWNMLFLYFLNLFVFILFV